MANPFKGKKGKEGDVAKLMEKDFTTWDVREVGLWLESNGLSRYRETFVFNEIDGEMLVDIDEDDLLALPIDRLGHRKKILRRVNMLRGTATSSLGSSSHAGSQVGSEAGSDTGSDIGSVSSTTSATSTKVRIKCSYKNEVTALTFRSDTTLADFKARIKEEFGRTLGAKYRDDEGDMVVIRDDQDLRDAFVCAQNMSVKLVLFSTRSKKEKKSKSKGKSSKGGGSESSDADFSVLENFVDGVVVIDRRGLVQFFNASAEDMFGYDREEVVGNNVRMLMNDDDAAKHNSYLRRYRREGTSQIIGKGRQVKAKTKEGKLFDVWLSLSETNTTYTGIIQELRGGGKAASDAQSTRSVERDLSAEFGAFNNYPDPVIVLNATGYIQFANNACDTAFLHDAGSLLGQNANTICPAVSSSSGEDLLSDFINMKKGRSKSGDSLLVNNRRDVICYTKKNTIVAKIADFAERTFDGTNYYVVQFRSQEKDTSGSILQAQREVIANLLIPALIIDENCIVQEMNGAARDIFGYNLSETLGRNIDLLLPPGEVKDNHTSWVKNYAATGKGRGPNGTSTVVGKGREVVGLSKSGELLTLKLSVTMAAEASGEKIFTGVIQLLSKTDANVMSSAVLQQQIGVINQLLVPACIISQDAIVRGFNKAAQDLFGYTEKELVGQDVGTLIPLGDIRNMHSKFVSRYAQGSKKPSESVVVGKGRKVTGRHKEGHNITATLSVTERKDGSLTIFTGMFT
uniref:Uncharacterized protein n=1 Tax=Paramoeba aestuarina TaxID=180227 RepID=A0A7S4UAV2_9EUKA|mmetsp:Transcript_40034/g.63290  ORF Transcript_40034/g.63290 Transcript_40034/m.63290 type:complete len:742 (+) Transcript_40034:66-2291(+)|eukprot:CAMPEP_0201507648 /NCGR_PEP_ID=MMETSP0161_2-20130828/1258_1 /ASSEMBLY_ACC=CAM_ASM_000251 /TAXON_ID=180227 /ORGANISM="Neoparamoeba aestuarina, Strain SoJaBio B1-5/56/2" /LENGTH=741 /DNA_ID=CAMNT_0047902077 /DNA_START=50 /DNA_END=2275 /DNA_ORIENTATION=-